MVEIKIGDKFKGHFTGTIYEVVAIGREKAIVCSVRGEETSSLKALRDGANYTKIEPWFEVGKTYRRAPHFDMRVEALMERDGKRAAACSYYAEDENRIGFITWSSFEGWQEV